MIKPINMEIGAEFWTYGRKWRCTDVGQRTIIGIALDHDNDPSWYNGPPYAIQETVFDEYDLEVCYHTEKERNEAYPP